jgi:predicted RND superfamily exporter protein
MIGDIIKNNKIMKNLKRIKALAFSIVMMLLFITQTMAQENTKVEKANEKFCNSVTGLITALDALDEANENATMDEFQDAYKKADKAYNKMIKSADKLENVEIKESVKAYNKMVDAINKIEGDAKSSDATDQINEHIDLTGDEIADILSTYCN